MSLLSVLKTIGKDLEHVGSWIDDALKVVGPIIEDLDPSLITIITGIEEILDGLPSTVKLDEAMLQSIVTSTVVVTVARGLVTIGKVTVAQNGGH